MAVVKFRFRVWLSPDDMLLRSCPKCDHAFSPCSKEHPALVVSATIHLSQKVACPGSCSLTVCTGRCPVGMSEDGIVLDSETDLHAAILQKAVTSILSCQSPEPSPSSPISFVIPPTSWKDSIPLRGLSGRDVERVSATVAALRLSGWYYEGLSWQDSTALLVPTSPGTFLVRCSSDPRFLFSLSVQTERGPTSVRLHYRKGRFRLDATPELMHVLPEFQCVVRLVEYYVAVTNSKDRPRGKEQVWIDCTGQTYSSILLTKPLYQKGRCPSLTHLARLAVNRLDNNVPTRELPKTLHRYLEEYPYTL